MLSCFSGHVSSSWGSILAVKRYFPSKANIPLVAKDKPGWYTLLHSFFCSPLLATALVDGKFPLPALALKLLIIENYYKKRKLS